MGPPVSDVLAEFASHLGPLAGAAETDIARLIALVGPIPVAWEEFLRAAGASTGNLKLRGHHTDLGLSLAEDVLPVLEKARKKEAAKGLKLAPVVATRFLVGMPHGRCQDCGPAWLDASAGEMMPRMVREALAATGGKDPVAVQIDEGEPRGKRAPASPFLLGESLAAWLFDTAFRQFRLTAAGPPQGRSVRPEHASAPHAP
ncbi:MAG: hypothetical protein K8T20_04950, partial [Planctomycetes bacterium]|nr:hypothetical protein [Planctomycetota bacterium]